MSFASELISPTGQGCKRCVAGTKRMFTFMINSWVSTPQLRGYKCCSLDPEIRIEIWMCLFNFLEWTLDVGVQELHACPEHCGGAGQRKPCAVCVETWRLLGEESKSGLCGCGFAELSDLVGHDRCALILKSLVECRWQCLHCPLHHC